MNTLIKAGIFVLMLAGATEVATHRSDGAAIAAGEHGEALFRTKGCITCHTHSGMERPQDWEASIGPDLTNYSNDPTFLRRWLEQPKAVRANATMPDLDLSASEIEDLIAFLNQPND